VARRTSPARLIIALSIAAVLAVFLLYTSIAGGGTPSLRATQLAGHAGRVSLTGRVVGPITGDSHKGGLRFGLRDPGTTSGASVVTVLYRGDLSDQFRAGRDVILDGTYRSGVFVGVPGTMLTKCPSRYTAKSQGK
jgi:cytochrome c-type biogenesis protein CcmE